MCAMLVLSKKNYFKTVMTESVKKTAASIEALQVVL